MPEKKIAVFGSKPMRIGASTVAPNMAKMCCRPSATDWAAGGRSSGAMIPSRLTVHWNMPRTYSMAAAMSDLLPTYDSPGA